MELNESGTFDVDSEHKPRRGKTQEEQEMQALSESNGSLLISSGSDGPPPRSDGPPPRTSSIVADSKRRRSSVRDSRRPTFIDLEDSTKEEEHDDRDEKKQGRDGFYHEAQIRERIKAMERYVTANELRNLRSGFSRAERQKVDGIDVVSSAEVRHVFSILSFDVSEKLLEALLRDCPSHSRGTYDLADIVQIYVSLKRIEYIKLPSSRTWEESAVISGALQTKNFLVDGHWRTIWNLFMLLLALIEWWCVLFRDGVEGWERPLRAGFATIDWISTTTIAIDIWLWFNTVVLDRGRVRTDNVARIRYVYRRRWLVFDVLSGLPLDVILSSAGASVAAGVFSHLRLLRVFRCLTFWSTSGHVARTAAFVKFHFSVLPVMKLCCLIGITLHFFAVVFLRIKHATNSLSDLGTGEFEVYVSALYFMIQTFTTVGYGDIRLCTAGELWFAIVIVFIALLLNGLIIGKLVSMLQLQSAEGRREDRLRETLAVLQFFDIPIQLQSEILNFQEHVLWTKADTAFNDITTPLPKAMVENIDLIRRISIIASEPLFATQSEAVLVQLAKCLVTRTSKPEEYVTCSSDTHQGVRWLLFGYVDKLDPHGRYITTLKTGDCFGFEGLMEMADEVYNYKALSYCDLLVCPAEDFHRIMNNFHTFAQHARRQLCKNDFSEENLPRGSPGHGAVRRLSVKEQHGKPRIVAIRNLYAKLRLYRHNLITYRKALEARGDIPRDEDSARHR